MAAPTRGRPAAPADPTWALGRLFALLVEIAAAPPDDDAAPVDHQPAERASPEDADRSEAA